MSTVFFFEMAAGLDDWEEHYGHNLETLEQRCLFRYRPSDITELAFATVTSHSGNRVKEIVDVAPVPAAPPPFSLTAFSGATSIGQERTGDGHQLPQRLR